VHEPATLAALKPILSEQRDERTTMQALEEKTESAVQNIEDLGSAALAAVGDALLGGGGEGEYRVKTHDDALLKTYPNASAARVLLGAGRRSQASKDGDEVQLDFGINSGPPVALPTSAVTLG